MPSLIVVARTRTEEVPLEGQVAVIGRDAGVTFELPDFKVSRRHALLVRTAEGFFVKDLGSRNGVYLNQQRVAARDQSRLKNGDVLQVGTTTLIFKDLAPDAGPEGAPTRAIEAAVKAAQESAKAAPAPSAPSAPSPSPPEPSAPSVEDTQDDPDPPGTSTAPGTGTVQDATVVPLPAPAPAPAPASAPAPAPAPAPAARKAPPRPAAPRRPAPARPAPARAVPRAALAAGAPIPRALPPRSQGDSHAELLLARALERAERERALLRNVCLALMGLLGLTLAWLIISALRGDPAPAPSAPAPTVAPAPAAPSAPPVAAAPPSAASRLDRARFTSEVQPVLAARCAGCHSFVGRGGNLLLAHGADPTTVAANFEAAARFVLPDGPERSPLLLKPLPPEEGGQPHGAGAAVLRAAEPAWKALQAWATSLAPPGAAPAPPVAAAPAAPRPLPASGGKNRAPTAVIAPLTGPGVVGQALELDAAGSADPDGDGLRFRWLLARRPDGSQARLEGGDGPRARLVADRPGAYEVAVVVHDGTDSARAALQLQVGTGPAAPPAAPADASREVALAKAVERLTGQRPGGAELAGLVALEGPALITALLERPALFERWWDDEQAWLLDGPTRPKGEPWASMPVRLREGRVGVKDVQYALAVGRDWSGRWAGKPGFVGAVLERLLGLDEAAAKAARPAAERMYDGYEAELFGQKGSSQADLVRIAAKDPRARRHALLRAWRRATGRDPEPAALDAALARLEGEPQAFFRVLAEAACRGL